MKFVILGCGSSMGVPRADSFFGKCNPKNKKNFRTRCSAVIMSKNENILIDTSPDLRHQLITNKVKRIDKVLYSHMHADQTHGINDLRVFYIQNKKTIPVYADNATRKYLLKSFGYCFKDNYNEYPATLNLNSIDQKIFIKDKNKKIKIIPIKVKHGMVESICYIIDKKLAYISDVSEIYQKDYKMLKNLKYLIIDCLWIKKHPSHFNLDECLKMIKLLKPKKAFLTNLHCDLDYKVLLNKLPNNIKPAYDGLTLTI